LISNRIQEIVYDVEHAIEQYQMTPEEYFVRVNVREIYEANVAMQAETEMTLEDFLAQLEAYLRGVYESNMALQSELTADELMSRIEARISEMLESKLNVQASEIDAAELQSRAQGFLSELKGSIEANVNMQAEQLDLEDILALVDAYLSEVYYQANMAVQAEYGMSIEDIFAQLEAYLRGLYESNYTMQAEQLTVEELRAMIGAYIRE